MIKYGWKVDREENRQIEPNQIVTEAAFNWYNNICSAVESRFSGFDNPSTYYKKIEIFIYNLNWKAFFLNILFGLAFTTRKNVVTKVINDVKYYLH